MTDLVFRGAKIVDGTGRKAFSADVAVEGVEDIPGTALWEGIDRRWESFGEYLDVLDGRHYSMDVGTQEDAKGYRATVAAGVITREHDEDTGARPGRLIRGARRSCL